MWALLGILAGTVAVVWLALSLRRRSAVAARQRCLQCGGNLLGYEQSPNCPHCFATLDDDEEEGDEPPSVDEIDEDYDEPERW